MARCFRLDAQRAVGVAEEALLAIHAAHNDVLGHADDVDPGQRGHGAIAIL